MTTGLIYTAMFRQHIIFKFVVSNSIVARSTGLWFPGFRRRKGVPRVTTITLILDGVAGYAPFGNFSFC